MIHVERVPLFGRAGLDQCRNALIRQIVQLRNIGEGYAPGQVNFLGLQRLQLSVRIAKIANEQTVELRPTSPVTVEGVVRRVITFDVLSDFEGAKTDRLLMIR